MPLPPVRPRTNLFRRFHAYPLPGGHVAEAGLGAPGQGTIVLPVQSQPVSAGFDALIVSDNPENLTPVPVNATLWRVRLSSANPTYRFRLYLYHGIETGNARNVSIVLFNAFRGWSLDVTASRTNTAVGQFLNPLPHGVQVALDYQAGQMTSLPPLSVKAQSSGLIDTIRINTGQLAHAIYDITISNPAMLHQPSRTSIRYTHADLMVITYRNATPYSLYFRWTPIQSTDGTNHPRGLYMATEIIRPATFDARLGPRPGDTRRLLLLSTGSNYQHGTDPSMHDNWLVPVVGMPNQGNYGVRYRIPVTLVNQANSRVTIRVYLTNQRAGAYAGAVTAPAHVRAERTTEALTTELNPSSGSVFANLLDTVIMEANSQPITREYTLLHAGGAAMPIALFFHTTRR
jgi:hypothetical protein